MIIIMSHHLHSPYTLTSLLDAELHSRAHSPHRADCLALILALVMGCHPRDAESTRRQHHVTAI